VSRGKSVDEGRGRDSRAWLGPPGEGGERLARVFGIGTSSQRDVGRTLEDLRTSLIRLEDEVDELALIVRRTVTHSSSVEPDHPSVVELPHVPQDSNREYWLSRCDHFTVYAGDRILGAVDGMRFASRLDRPDFLEVRCGRLGRQVLLVSVDDVEAVEPEEKAIVLRAARPIPSIRGSLRLRLERLRTQPRALLH
jgi:hypothetical protein